MKGLLIQDDPQIFLHDIQDIPHLIGKTYRVLNIRAVFRVHKMKRDKSGLILRKKDTQPLADQFYRIFPQLVFLRIKSPDLPEQRVLQVDPLLPSLYGEIDMVRERHIDTLVQLQLQRALRIGYDIVGDFRVFRRYIGEQFPELLSHAAAFDAENLLNFGLVHAHPGFDAKPKPAPHDYYFTPHIVTG